MSTAPAIRPAVVRWIIPVGLGVLLAIGVLWSIPAPEWCPAVYPGDPDCGRGPADAAVIGSVLLVFGFAAFVTCALLVSPRRRPLVLGILAGGLGLIVLVSAMAALQSGAVAISPVY